MQRGQRASETRNRRRGYSRAKIDEILEKNSNLSRAEMLRCKPRYFTDGVAIGNKSFVYDFFQRFKESLAG